MRDLSLWDLVEGFMDDHERIREAARELRGVIRLSSQPFTNEEYTLLQAVEMFLAEAI